MIVVRAHSFFRRPALWLVLTLAMLLSACATTSTQVMVDRIRDGNGYALIVVHTNWEPYEIGFERLQLFFVPEGSEGRAGKVRVRRSGELELVELPAGRYRWREARLGSHSVSMSQDSGFRVIEGAITYIGDLHAAYDPATRKLVQLEVAENQVQVRERVRQAIGPLLDRYPLRADEIMTLAPSAPLPGTREAP